MFPERTRTKAPFAAVCGCKPNSGCRDDCINEKMHYLCGKDCPSGESCTNQSLSKRKTPKIKIHYVSHRRQKHDIPANRVCVDWLARFRSRR